MVNLIEEAKQVVDPTQSASAGTEAALRANPVTAPATSASDAVDDLTGSFGGGDSGGSDNQSIDVERPEATTYEGEVNTIERFGGFDNYSNIKDAADKGELPQGPQQPQGFPASAIAVGGAVVAGVLLLRGGI